MTVFHAKPLLDDYLAGPEQLRLAVSGMSPDELRARPVPNKWSTLEVVCHLSDFEPIYADRMKRVLAEDQPPLRGGDPDLFASRFCYHDRDVNEELDLIAITRRQLARILASASAADFERIGIHSEDGPLSLQQLLTRITKHIPHHIAFIQSKREKLRGG